MIMRRLFLPLLLVAACDASSRDTPAPDAPTPDAPTPDASTPARPDAAAAPAIDFQRERTFDFDADGSAEQVSVTARGATYDSLDIVLAITRAAGDTLWKEAWPSLLYFQYDPREGMADSTVERIVTGHLEDLLRADRFSASGLPPQLSHGGDPRQTMLEAVHYHLAELDWRRRNGLNPAQATPPNAHSAIKVDSVPASRANAIVDELMTRPSFMYYAGGEATYAIAWSPTEKAFVRIFACC